MSKVKINNLKRPNTRKLSVELKKYKKYLATNAMGQWHVYPKSILL